MTMTNDQHLTDAEMADFFARSLTHQVYATEVRKPKTLGNVTWCLGDEPPARLAADLLWCDRGPRVHRAKPAKINGITHQEIE